MLLVKMLLQTTISWSEFQKGCQTSLLSQLSFDSLLLKAICQWIVIFVSSLFQLIYLWSLAVIFLPATRLYMSLMLCALYMEIDYVALPAKSQMKCRVQPIFKASVQLTLIHRFTLAKTRRSQLKEWIIRGKYGLFLLDRKPQNWSILRIESNCSSYGFTISKKIYPTSVLNFPKIVEITYPIC